jgi:hypothetical protein
MKLSINIQSLKRANDIKTLRIFPEASVWVHEFEFDEYVKANPGAHILRLPDDLRGNLPGVKNWILNASFNGVFDDACLLLDDDIYKVGYFEGTERTYLEGDELLRFVEKYTLLCQEWGFFLWGININNDKQCYREYTPFGTVQYVSSSFACFLKGNTCLYDERFPLKEDYDMTLQQCNVNRGLLRLNKWHYTKLGAQNVGGCADYRQVAKEREQLELLQKKWGSRIVQMDGLEHSRNHITKKERNFDINPVIHVPINGV